MDCAEFGRFGFSVQGGDAVRHLLEVASGLDSQMLGETEIFGQAKRAFATAQTRGAAGPALNRLFQKAFQAAKLLLVDLAMPRDIEPAAGLIENVFLYNLDDLAMIAEKNRRARAAEAERARAVLAPRIALLWLQVQAQLAAGVARPAGAPCAGERSLPLPAGSWA